VTWDQNDNLLAHVEIQSGGKLTITAEIGMPKDAKITIQPNGELYVNGGRLYNSCEGYRWEGIIVVGNSLFHQHKVYGYRAQGYLSLSNEAIIEGANTAAVNHDRDVPGTNGGVIIADNATFRNNLTGVNFANYQNSHFITGAPQRDLSIFTNCIFSADGNFGSDFDGFYGMAILRKVNGIRFQACTFTNDYPSEELTYVDEKGYAISAVNAGFQLSGICLSNPLYPCTEYVNSTIRGFAIGITTGLYGSISTFSVSNTNFIQNARGIVAQSVNNIYVVDNTFIVGSSLPHLNEEAPFSGVEIYRSTGYRIEENFFEIADELPTSMQTVGIFIGHTWYESNVVYKNDIRGFNCANLSNGDNRGSNADDGLQYLCNENKGNDFDFSVPDEVSGVVGVAEMQGSSNRAAANIFSGVLSSSDLEMHFQNHGEPLTYFTPPSPTNYSMNSITLEPGLTNTCPTRLPSGREIGRLKTSEREELEDLFQESTNAREKIEAANMLIRDNLINEDSIHFGEIQLWLARKGGLDAYFALVDSWLQLRDTSAAQQVLNDIPSLITLSGRAQIEYDYFTDLKEIQINAIQTGISDSVMAATHLVALKNIAEAGHYYASVQAQVLLNDLANTDYQLDIVLPSPTPQNLTAPRAGNHQAITENGEMVHLQAVPNPVVEETLFHFRLPEGVEQAQIIITSLDGKIVEQIPVYSDTSVIRWQTGNKKPGMYFYALIVGARTMLSGRLVIVK
ncbi:MAG: hypothetical protein KF852_17385, partial [Saprospiraceae bacterium]|nr:hypothetical protein [Saprospiraceae bacterium]